MNKENKAEVEAKKLAEAEQLKKDEAAQKAQEELDKKKLEDERRKNEEIEKERLEMAKLKEGDIVALGDVTVKPVKISGNAPAINASLKNKYKGKVMNVPVQILVDENGVVTKIKILTANVAVDIKTLLENTLDKWKYKPAQKDNIKVKVWLTVPVKFNF